MTPEERRDWLTNATSGRVALARARTDALCEDISRWRKSNPLSTTLHVKDSPACGWYVEVDAVDPSPALDSWGFQLGEVAHHLRSTLNTTLTRIVSRDGGTPSRALQYPIANTSGAWRSALKRGQLRDLPQRVIRAIYACQPFLQTRGTGSRPEDNVLSVLSWLNNTDKHRLEIAGELSASWVTHEALITTTEGKSLLVNPHMEHDWSLAPGSRLVDADSSPHSVLELHQASLDLQTEVVIRDQFGMHTVLEQLLEEIWSAFQQAQTCLIIAWADENVNLDIFAGATDFKRGSAFGMAATDSINGVGTWERDLLRRDVPPHHI